MYQSGEDIPRHGYAQKYIFTPFGQENMASVGTASDSYYFLHYRLIRKGNLKSGQNVNNYLGEAGALCLEYHWAKLKDE